MLGLDIHERYQRDLFLFSVSAMYIRFPLSYKQVVSRRTKEDALNRIIKIKT